MSDFSDELKPAEPQAPAILEQERSRSNLSVDQLAQHLLSRGGFLERQGKILQVIENRPIFSKKNQLNLARPDRYQLSLARSKELRRLAVQHGWSPDDYRMAQYLVGEVSPYAIHNSMFITSVREQCNPEQMKYWLPKAENWEIIGAYSQTELGHGSNVRGIETIATWNNDTKDFTIHSPTLTAAKWWNGSLGRTANHAIVIAQLLLPENGKLKSYGPHQFIVQIRDMKTNRPLDGVVIGDIGTKFGYSFMDNGYMLFKNFKVPHSALLSKYTGVSLDGKYIKPENQAIVYGSMTFIRASIIMESRLVLARACTVAVRYLSIRRQFSDRDAPGGPELSVLDYPTVQIRILPLLAATYALHYTGEAMFKLYWDTRADIEQKGDMSRLAELHAASSGLKACCTLLVADGSETCRRALGGHGFGGGSGLIPLVTDHLDKPTVEGDSWMISQQTAAYLIKRMTAAVEGKCSEPIDSQFQTYLQEKTRGTQRQYDVYNKPADVVAAFKDRVSHLAYKAYEARIVQKQSWTNLMIDLHRMAIAHSESILIENFHAAVFGAANLSQETPQLDGSARAVMQDLFRLFALTTISTNSTDFLLSSALTPSHLATLTSTIQALMSAIRPHAVRLVDAWSIPDYLLDSALGRKDGDVYNALWKKAHLENPLNLNTFNPDYRTEEIIMGEGEVRARRRIEAMAQGLEGHEQRGSGKSKL